MSYPVQIMHHSLSLISQKWETQALVFFIMVHACQWTMNRVDATRNVAYRIATPTW